MSEESFDARSALRVLHEAGLASDLGGAVLEHGLAFIEQSSLDELDLEAFSDLLDTYFYQDETRRAKDGYVNPTYAADPLAELLRTAGEPIIERIDDRDETTTERGYSERVRRVRYRCNGLEKSAIVREWRYADLVNDELHARSDPRRFFEVYAVQEGPAFWFLTMELSDHIHDAGAKIFM